MKISIIYSSDTGHTHRLARAIDIGCRVTKDTNTQLIRLSEQDFTGSRWHNEAILSELDNSDAIIFGSPTFMGCLSSELKAFMEATVSRYMAEMWNGKVAGGFTVSGASAGDKFNTLTSLSTFAMQHGMIWVGLGANPFNKDQNINLSGHYYGATGCAGPNDDPVNAPTQSELKAGEFLGKRVALYTTKIAYAV